MKNRIIITATFAACLALCAAVWPQTEKKVCERIISQRKV